MFREQYLGFICIMPQDRELQERDSGMETSKNRLDLKTALFCDMCDI